MVDNNKYVDKVKLLIYFDDDGETKNLTIPSVSKELGWIAHQTIIDGGQVLVFVNTRRSTQACSREIAKIIPMHLDKETKDKLEILSKSFKKSKASSINAFVLIKSNT